MFRKILHISNLNSLRQNSKENCRHIGYSFYLMKKEMEKLKSNPFYTQYADKIATLQETSPEEFLTRAEKAFEEEKSSENSGKTFSKAAEAPKSMTSLSSYGFVPEKKLERVMKTELLEDKSTKEIEFIWTEHFRDKDTISGVLPVDLFDKIMTRAKKYPMFLFPLLRDQGYEFVYVQFAANEIHFTTLINYQAYHENAPECLTIIHYPDLAEKKNVVLMVGEYNKDVLSAHEAQFLANQVQLYYAGDKDRKLALLESFHNKPDAFKHTDLIEQIETVTLDLPTKKS